MSKKEFYSGGGEKTIAKTIILKKYLKAYLDILGKPENWSGQKWYVDTHAGTGFTEEFGIPIPGSALRALNYDFDRFYFYETNERRFKTLIQVLTDETDANFHFGTVGNTDHRRASSEDPYIQVMNMDCNEGVKWLARKGSRNAHWFTFVDPERFSVKREFLEELCSRENMDILLNFQTSGFLMNITEATDHSDEIVEECLGSGYPKDSSSEQLVEWFKKDLFAVNGWNSASQPMVSEGGNNWRYDLIFASQNDTAMGIIDDIYDRKLEREVNEEIKEWRDKSDIGQKGLETYVRIPTEDEEPEDGQASLRDFEDGELS